VGGGSRAREEKEVARFAWSALAGKLETALRAERQTRDTAVKQKIQDDLKAAMKSGDKSRVMALRGLLSEISRVEKDVRREPNEAEIVAIVKRERARRAEALEFARKANRSDLIEQNEAEARVLAAYLPAELPAEEVKAAIDEIIAGGATQMGAVMKALREKFGARLDGKMASEMVKQSLAPKTG
jgi:uncharacterized protein